jgi:lipid II:glycine glycyltransferase (peptidoglycan interpeptide bridge formation enzyme)
MDSKSWNNLIVKFHNPHILQTWQWGELKAHFGWKPFFRVWGNDSDPDAAALVLERSIKLAGLSTGLRVLYVPKGPLLKNWADQHLVQKVLLDLEDFAREKGAIFIKIDPDVVLGSGIPDTKGDLVNPTGMGVRDILSDRGWHYSDEQIQFRNTVVIDLTPSEDELLSNMKQKTRYNIRLAKRKGVIIRFGTISDFDMLYQMYLETSLRDDFVIREPAYYKKVWGIFSNNSPEDHISSTLPSCEPIIAEVNGMPVAAVVIFRFAGTAYYMHGMSFPVHRNKMPNYLLQWAAMRRSKEAGCERYDLWGAPEVFGERDPLWGVFRFKQGLAGEVVRTIGAYDYPVREIYYRLYARIVPRVLHFARNLRPKEQEEVFAEI